MNEYYISANNINGDQNSKNILIRFVSILIIDIVRNIIVQVLLNMPGISERPSNIVELLC